MDLSSRFCSSNLCLTTSLFVVVTSTWPDRVVEELGLLNTASSFFLLEADG